MRKLNLGCGLDYKSGWINVDVADVRKDVSHDLNKIPYPFRADTFDEILMRMSLEHVDKPISVLRELIRIGKNNSKITIIVPHANSYANLTDIQHKTSFTEHSFDEELLQEYELIELILENQEYLFKHSWKKYLPLKSILKIFFNGIYDDLLFEFRIKK